MGADPEGEVEGEVLATLLVAVCHDDSIEFLVLAYPGDFRKRVPTSNSVNPVERSSEVSTGNSLVRGVLGGYGCPAPVLAVREILKDEALT